MNKIKRMIRRAQNNPLSKWNTFLNFIRKNNRNLKRLKENLAIKYKEFSKIQKENFSKTTIKTKKFINKRKAELDKWISIEKDKRIKLNQIKAKEKLEIQKAQKQEAESLKKVKEEQIKYLQSAKEKAEEIQKKVYKEAIEKRLKLQELEVKRQEVQEKQEQEYKYKFKLEKQIRRKEFIERKIGKMKEKTKRITRSFTKIVKTIKLKIKNRRVLTLDTSMPKEITVEYSPKSYVSESFRTLRTNIQFMNANKNVKTILVTSTMPGEGKSYVSSNLAATFAQSDKRVVIVDADMRKGRLHEIFKVTKNPGLSNYLSGIGSKNMETPDVNDFVYKTSIHNLFIMPMGNTPPNPSELIASENMVKLIKELKEYYDVVIFDGTPSKIVTDAVILSREVDTTLIVTGHNKTKMDDLKKVQKDIENVGGKIAGVVINSVPIDTKKYASSYYYEDIEGTRKKVKKMYSL